GAMWLGTMSKTKQAGAGAIYHFRDGVLTKLFADITIPNAICFSPDGVTAYFTDTMSGKIMQVAINPEDALPTEKPKVFFRQPRNDVGGIDGAICDADGNLWNARWGSNCLDRYTRFGERAECIALPVSQPSCPAFVGGNHIAVTSAWESMDDAMRSADPHAGKTVLIEFDKPVHARFEPRAVI
ncbi:MAG: SMP-30/gluconolactonase/LRE family protein, partial [Pseudomonadota bacterium]